MMKHKAASPDYLERMLEMLTSVGRTVLMELKLDDCQFRQLISNSQKLSQMTEDALNRTLKKFLVTQQNREGSSNYGYLSGYEKPRSIAEQVGILRGIFPELCSFDEGLADGELPKHAEGWFAIPKWQRIAPTYAEAVQKVLDAVKSARNGKFYNYRDGQITNDHLCQSGKTVEMFQKLGDKQKDYDILVVAAQFGLRHRGRSVSRSREVMQANECGLGAFAVGIMILTHPERLSHYDDLWIDCVGDELDDPTAPSSFGHAPSFVFSVGEVELDLRECTNVSAYFGSASFFIPES